MLDFPLWKRLSLWALTIFLALAAMPSILSLSGVALPDWAEEPQINLGLDLAGGSHILLEADPGDVALNRLETMEDSVRQAFQDADPEIRITELSTADGRLEVTLEESSEIDRAREEILPLINGTGVIREWDLQVLDGNRMVLTQTSAALDAAVDNAMEAATEVIRGRIDRLGTREPTIIRQGDNRIVVQVPGLEDPEALKDLIGETARLEFKLVDPDALPSEVAQGFSSNPSVEVLPYAPDTAQAGTNLAVFRLGGLSGESLTDATASKDSQTNEDIVNITFDSQGAAIFARLSTENVGRQFAIILDDQVISAPVFQSAILGGQARISGSFNAETANKLAIQLSSGALPVELAVVEERTVGPDLGRDSIVAGAVAMGVGSLLVIILMIATYGRFGVYSTIALVFNVLMILGIMAYINTTLTLPGIAGFVLTIGAAVDANVLINERMREERRRGRRVVAAVETGYREASRAIYDANVTNFIAGVLLFLFGSGPVRGFAVVLIIGLFTSVFTAVTLTRMWVAGWLKAKRPNELHV